MANTIHEQVSAKLDELEAELRLLGYWGGMENLPDDEILGCTVPFGCGVMEFHTWIEYFLIMRLREMCQNEIPLPPKMSTEEYGSVYYMKTMDKHQNLLKILKSLDTLISEGN